MMGHMFRAVPKDVDLESHILRNHLEGLHQGEVYRYRRLPLLDLLLLSVFPD